MQSFQWQNKFSIPNNSVLLNAILLHDQIKIYSSHKIFGPLLSLHGVHANLVKSKICMKSLHDMAKIALCIKHMEELIISGEREFTKFARGTCNFSKCDLKFILRCEKWLHRNQSPLGELVMDAKKKILRLNIKLLFKLLSFHDQHEILVTWRKKRKIFFWPIFRSS